MGDPKHLAGFDLEVVASHVSRGRYRRWTDRASVPDSLSTWTEYAEPGVFRGVVLAESSTSMNPPTLGGIGVPAGASVYLLRTVRLDEKSTGPHMNADDRLLFRDPSGNVIQVTRHEHPEHFEPLSHDTGLSPAVQAGQLPPREEGPLSDFSRGVDFST